MRYISNRSSGKQGVAIANALSRIGVKTKLILGPSESQVDKDIKVIKVTTGVEMMNAVKKLLPVDIAICAAAVSDVKPLNKNKDKLKKSWNQLNNLELNKNPDILEYLGKTNKSKPKLIVGFSAETKDLIKNSKKKLEKNIVILSLQTMCLVEILVLIVTIMKCILLTGRVIKKKYRKVKKTTLRI